VQLILYYAPNACSLVPYVTLTEAGTPFEVRPLNFRKSQHMMPDYLQLNPKHKVPLLVIDGRPLTENVAIQIWIARNFPAAKLLPVGDLFPTWTAAVWFVTRHKLSGDSSSSADSSPVSGEPEILPPGPAPEPRR